MINNNYSSDIFPVTVQELDEVMASAQKRGAGYADIFMEDSHYGSIILQDGLVSKCTTGRDCGAGIRAVCGDRTGFASCSVFSLKEMLRAADVASTIADCSLDAEFTIPATQIKGENNFYPMVQDWESVDDKKIMDLLYTLERKLREKDGRIVKVIAQCGYFVQDVLMYNSFGELACDKRPSGKILVTIIFSNGKVTDSRSCSRAFRMGFEMMTEALLDEIVEKLVSGIDRCFEARRPKGGRMSVVMGAGESGILLHEAMGHAFEADFNRKGQSIFSDRMGKKICPAGINIVDDGTVPGNRGSVNFDDEGVPGQKTYMVTDGVLTSYLHDRVSAAHYGVAPTGNGRRESCRYKPIPRMRLTYMENGDRSPDDIISSVESGIYVDEFSNGQVKIGEGDFTFYVKSGYLIENGHLTMPIKDINVIGNGPRALSDIKAVGNDLKISNAFWVCGKDQTAPVSCGMPTVLIDNLTVGGE